ncbi:hypothetical protein EQG49_03900 [Periweissella cryptocerci]|uniref:Uncharacterized protein n=1 Tax=Periweissella cryptocerci TaxID=2506420 RepID=A0A4P6YSL5_9LACO|nr:hypothetical protein [Periweissella cryptocerci]QBO35661.1 hypothetical protein EQG49_03900 [Periweissella cryptocerci]
MNRIHQAFIYLPLLWLAILIANALLTHIDYAAACAGVITLGVILTILSIVNLCQSSDDVGAPHAGRHVIEPRESFFEEFDADTNNH